MAFLCESCSVQKLFLFFYMKFFILIQVCSLVDAFLYYACMCGSYFHFVLLSAGKLQKHKRKLKG